MSNTRCRIVARVLLAAMMLVCGHPAFALNPRLDISQYGHTAWRVSEGFFSNGITAIAQTPDGYLWLGTNNGLLRFDGVRAVAWQPRSTEALPSNDITSLLVTRDGVLWIGTRDGLVSLEHGMVVQHPTLAGHGIGPLIEDREGALWVPAFHPSSGIILCVIVGNEVECHGKDGGPGAGAANVYEDRNGNIWGWGIARAGLWRMKPQPATFVPLPLEAGGATTLFEDDGPGLLYTATGGIRRFVDGRTTLVHSLRPLIGNLKPLRVLRDRDGGVWFSTGTAGLGHTHKGISGVFRRSDGLSDDYVYKIFEDREGSIWVATRGGLDRFREPKIVAYSSDQGLSHSMVSSVLGASDGSVWAGTFDGVNRLADGGLTVYRQPGLTTSAASRSGRPGRSVVSDQWAGSSTSIFEDRAGRVWVSKLDAVVYIADDRLVRVPGLPGGNTRAIGEDRRGNLWIANDASGLFRLSADASVVDRFTWADLGRKDPVSALAVDAPTGAVWLGFSEGGVLEWRDHRIRASHDAASGLAPGRVRHLLIDSSQSLWVSTHGGLSRIKDGRVATITTQNGLPCNSVQWAIEDDSQSLWVGTLCGLTRIARRDLDDWWANARPGNAGYAFKATHFDSVDGVRIPSATNFTSPVAKSRDGRLWFLHENGLGVIDPRRIPSNPLPPPVAIELLTANRVTHDVRSSASAPVSLPPLIRDLQIDYTALSLVAPEKMRFRYMLEGRDASWQDVGTRRQAFYSDLSPGQYRFRVAASNNDGVWNEQGASVDFEVAAAYYQTTWFMALVAGILLTLFWGAHRIRLRIVETHEREISKLNEKLMSAQEQERIRIAGELHDGVMQEMLAATMMLGTAKRRIAAGQDAQPTIDKVQQKLVHAGTEIRQLSHDLHPPALQDAGLPDALRSHCEDFSASCGIAITCDADDRVNDLSRGAALALFRIVQEALGNAAKHSKATRISVGLVRSTSEVSLTVSDNGVGFDRGLLTSSGGLGLITMRERAGQLNGTFEFTTAPGRGTTIKVVVPFR